MTEYHHLRLMVYSNTAVYGGGGGEMSMVNQVTYTFSLFEALNDW